MTTASRPTRRAALLGLSCVALAACGRAPLVAGSDLAGGPIGGPTAQNHLVMTSRGEAAAHLNDRFAASVPTVVNFPFDSAHLTGEARAVLEQQAHFMRQFPEVRFSVYGHTDLVGPEGYNRDLGRRRAEAAVRYIGARGVSLDRLDALVSFGEERPLVPAPGPVEVNRRAVTEVAGFVSGNPLVLDGKYAQIVYRAYVARGAGGGVSVAAAPE
jgi:outer membrane protein OmpA-like peptidoglycan-associated protein